MFAIPPKHLSCYLNSTPVNAANQRLSGVLFDLKSISYQVSPVFLSKFPEHFLCFFEISLWNTHIPFPTRLSINISFIGYFLFVLVTLHENFCLNFVLFACLICCSLVFTKVPQGVCWFTLNCLPGLMSSQANYYKLQSNLHHPH